MNRTVRLPLLTLLILSVAGGCMGSRQAERAPDDRFGHRFEDSTGGRDTIALAAADSSQDYFYYPAVYDTLHIRPAPFDPERPAESQQVPVEVLVKGSFPDACSDLHRVVQERIGHFIEARLDMRRPQGAVCASVVRPYRFYLMLEGTYGPGDYILKLNGRAHAFVVRAPENG